MTEKLFSPLALGPVTLQHRVVMAPLTRMRASPDGNVPHALNALYYAQRATPGGLLIAEASPVSWPRRVTTILESQKRSVIGAT